MLSSLQTGLENASPWWLAVALFLSTFILEDAAAVGAGLLLAAGSITWPAAYTACCFGIWTGDAGLYALARMCGRNWFERSALRRHAQHVARSERWLAARADRILVLSRLVPGARLPTYLAAGFLRLPLGRFLAVTGAASMVWTGLVLALGQWLGERSTGWLGACRLAGGLFLVAALSGLGLGQARRKLAQVAAWPRWRARLGRWRRWEFWPTWLFYLPVIGYYAWLALKHRGLTLPTLANPAMFTGGIVGESKMTTLRDLMETSPAFTAPAELITGSNLEERLGSLREIRTLRRLNLPFILKPDVGQRGAGVKLIRTDAEAEAYLRRTTAPLLVQHYVAGPREVGVFYCRLPGQTQGRILAITEKVFPILTGDGYSTVEALVRNDARARFMADTYLRRLAGREREVLPKGSTLKLVETGNHAQGCIFRNGMHLWTPALEERIDTISRRLDGFFIGRYDIRFSSDDDLRRGCNFQIIELNGAASETTSIYDARNSLFAAYRTLFRQWRLVFAVGAANRQLGRQPTPLRVVWRAWRDYCRHSATYPAAD